MSSGPESASFAVGGCLPHCPKRSSQSIERTSSGKLRLPTAAAHVER